jgi:hypothetical protein
MMAKPVLCDTCQGLRCRCCGVLQDWSDSWSPVVGFKETFQINGENLLQKIKEIIAEGNVSKISISDKHGKEIMSFPVTVGAIGLILAPVFAAIGAVAALLTECTITVERNTNKEEKDKEDNSTDPPTTITVK